MWYEKTIGITGTLPGHKDVVNGVKFLKFGKLNFYSEFKIYYYILLKLSNVGRIIFIFILFFFRNKY